MYDYIRCWFIYFLPEGSCLCKHILHVYIVQVSCLPFFLVVLDILLLKYYTNNRIKQKYYNMITLFWQQELQTS